MTLYSIKEASEKMNVATCTIRKLIRTKQLRALKVLNKYRIEEDALLECFRKMEI